MESLPQGVEVPMPTSPLLLTNKFVAEDEPTTNCGAEPMPFAFTEKSPHGVDVPTPTKLRLLMTKLVAEDDPTTNCGAEPMPFAFTESNPQGVEEPKPANPVFSSVNAGAEDVAKRSVVVPMKRLPPREENIQCLRFATAPRSVSTKLSPVVVAICSTANGDDVPRPKFPTELL